MSNLYRPVEATFETIVYKLFAKKKRPLLIGEVSLETGHSLRTVEHQLNELVDKGALRIISYSEKKSLKMHDLVVAYVMVDASKFTLLSRLL